MPRHYNYFLGNYPDDWRTRVPAFRSILYRGIHEGIDLRVREGQGGILAISDAALATMQTVHGAQVWIDLASPLLFHLVPTANAIGATEVFLPIPNDPALANLQAFAQFAWPDPCLPGGMAASNALALTIQP